MEKQVEIEIKDTYDLNVTSLRIFKSPFKQYLKDSFGVEVKELKVEYRHLNSGRLSTTGRIGDQSELHIECTANILNNNTILRIKKELSKLPRSYDVSVRMDSILVTFDSKILVRAIDKNN